MEINLNELITAGAVILAMYGLYLMLNKILKDKSE